MLFCRIFRGFQGSFFISQYCRRLYSNLVLACSVAFGELQGEQEGVRRRLYLAKASSSEEPLQRVEMNPRGCQSHTFTRAKFTWKKTLLNILCVGAIHDKQRLWFHLLWITFAYDYLNRPCLCWLSWSIIGRCLWMYEFPFQFNPCLNFTNKLFSDLVSYCSCCSRIMPLLLVSVLPCLVSTFFRVSF